MINYERIQKDCFWDMAMSEEDIKQIVVEESLQAKTFLFKKILLNSTALFKDLAIFSKNDLAILTESFEVPMFNNEYIFRRKNLVEVYFLDKPLLIDELKWTA